MFDEYEYDFENTPLESLEEVLASESSCYSSDRELTNYRFITEELATPSTSSNDKDTSLESFSDKDLLTLLEHLDRSEPQEESVAPLAVSAPATPESVTVTKPKSLAPNEATKCKRRSEAELRHLLDDASNFLNHSTLFQSKRTRSDRKGSSAEKDVEIEFTSTKPKLSE